MNAKQLHRMQHDKGFIAALDQSGGSTPKALAQYGVPQTAWSTEEQMFDLVHQMRTRVIKSPAFTSDRILGAILFEGTMDRSIDGLPTADFLWEKKGVVPFLKVDKGLADLRNGVQLMKPMPDLDILLAKAKSKNIFGTKMRSVIKEANEAAINEVVAQQFEMGLQIFRAGLVPILEPEVDIHSPDKAQSEVYLKKAVLEHLASLDKDIRLMFKFSIPTQNDFYVDVMEEEHVVRVVALSGGYSQEEANKRLTLNHGLIGSFSRALLEGLSANQTHDQFNATLTSSIEAIYQASIT